MLEEPIDSREWTGVSGGDPLEKSPVSPQLPITPSKFNQIRVWSILALAGGLAVVIVVNNMGVQRHVEPGRVSWVRFIAAHWAGKTWENDHWVVHFSLGKEDGDLSLNQAPPKWLSEKSLIVVTYGHGRIYNDIIVEDIRPAPSSDH